MRRLIRFLGQMFAKPRTSEQFRDELRERFDWEARLHAAGWREWAAQPPPPFATVEMQRRDWPTIHVSAVEDIHPATNCAGLWWREWRGPTIEAAQILELGRAP